MVSKWLLVAPVAGALGVGAGLGANELFATGKAMQDLKPAVGLSLTRVVLFNSGVGYFSRSGDVDGDARVDLTFPESDINDLLKSMVLEDFGKGRVAAVSYDSREPLARTLGSFAVNLTGSPTFADIVSQMRGERIEVAVGATASNQPGKLTGTIVGVEHQKVPAGAQTIDAEVLNMVLDVQPNEERLLSYAIDLGTEVDPKAGAGAQKITSVKAVKGIVTTVTQVTDEKTYRVINRSRTDRTLLIEHPNRTSQQFMLVGTEKPVEDTPEVYRFQTPVKADETKSFTVKEERDVTQTAALSNGAEDQIRYFISLSEAGPDLKQKLDAALKVKGSWDTIRHERDQVVADLARLAINQDRIRKNLRETPKEAEVYATYLKKLSTQEKEIDALTAKQKALMADEFTARKKYEDHLANITDWGRSARSTDDSRRAVPAGLATSRFRCGQARLLRRP